MAENPVRIEMVGSHRKDGGRKRARLPSVDIERRLFEHSLGKIRLLDTVLDKANLPKLAAVLRDVIVEWRAYPSLTAFSGKDLRDFAEKLGRVAAGLEKVGHPDAAQFVREIAREIKGWRQGGN